jgi:hypothetical protein
MSDARWLEIDASVASAVKHFAGAVAIADRITADPSGDRYVAEMALMHAMQAGHTSLEAALLRILDLFGEEPPSGAQWHSDLIRRTSAALGNRPPILTGAVAEAADETRQFRNIAARAYDNFKLGKAGDALAGAGFLAEHLPEAIARFRQAVDP